MIFINHKFIDTDKLSVKFEAINGVDILGSCILRLENDHADITNIEFSAGNAFIVVGLIKAALNFACNRNYYIGRCSAKNIDSLLDNMNFIKKEGYYENDIPSVLMGSCGSCGV